MQNPVKTADTIFGILRKFLELDNLLLIREGTNTKNKANLLKYSSYEI